METTYNIIGLRKEIGERLCEIRIARKEKIDAVARSIGLSEGTVSKIECGRYNSLKLEHIALFAHYYKVTLHELIPEHLRAAGENESHGI